MRSRCFFLFIVASARRARRPHIIDLSHLRRRRVRLSLSLPRDETRRVILRNVKWLRLYPCRGPNERRPRSINIRAFSRNRPPFISSTCHDRVSLQSVVNSPRSTLRDEFSSLLSLRIFYVAAILDLLICDVCFTHCCGFRVGVKFLSARAFVRSTFSRRLLLSRPKRCAKSSRDLIRSKDTRDNLKYLRAQFDIT